jgi:hypothetical protein
MELPILKHHAEIIHTAAYLGFLLVEVSKKKVLAQSVQCERI